MKNEKENESVFGLLFSLLFFFLFFLWYFWPTKKREYENVTPSGYLVAAAGCSFAFLGVAWLFHFVGWI